MIREWIKSNTFWHPLTGDLPSHFLSNIPNHIDMRCLYIIQEARTLWRPFSGNDGPDLLMAQALFEHVLDVFSRARLFDPLVQVKDGQKIEQRGPDQVSERDLLWHARYEIKIDERYLITRMVKDYEVFSILAIHLAWGILEKILLEKQSADDPEILRKIMFAKTFLSKANEKREQWKKIEASRKGGLTSKTEPAFLFLAEHAWKNEKRTSLSAWKYLMRELDHSGGDAMIKGHDFEADLQKNRISLYYRDGKSRDCSFRTFQRYFGEFKKNLKKKSQ